MIDELGPPRLAMRGIGKRFGATEALAGVDLTARAGEIHALLGQNGAGKSTLMQVLSGAIQPDRGSIELDGIPFRPRDPAEGRKAGVAMIYQELSLAPHLTVTENIWLGAELVSRGFLARSDMRRRAAEVLANLGHASIPLDVPVRRLPIAERQMVEIGRALSTGCRVVVLDEPTSSLAKPDQERLFATMRQLAREGHALVFITHFLEEALAIADRYSVLRDGRIVATGATADVSPDQIVAAMIGTAESVAYPHSARVRGDAILTIDGLAGREKPARASLTLHRGEVVGIFGLVGSGRTELCRAIFGLDPVVSGAVSVLHQVGPATPAERWVQGVGMQSEDRSGEGLALDLSVADNLMLSRLARGPLDLVTKTRQRRASRPWVERLGIRLADVTQPVRQLSGGNQQKVALGRLLHHQVDVLLLDEPTRGIDVGAKHDIYRLIDQLVAGSEPRKAVLIVGSYLPELLGICDRIAVMCRGVLGPAIDVDQTDEATLLRMASTGTA